jgi:hypothetical protein
MNPNDTHNNPPISELVIVECPECSNHLAVTMTRNIPVATDVTSIDDLKSLTQEAVALVDSHPMMDDSQKKETIKILTTPGFVPEPAKMRQFIEELKMTTKPDAPAN